MNCPTSHKAAFCGCGDLICGIRLLMKRVRDSIAHIYDGTTLADLLAQVEEAKQEKRRVLDFSI